MRILSHLLKESLMENFIFLCSAISNLLTLFPLTSYGFLMISGGIEGNNSLILEAKFGDDPLFKYSEVFIFLTTI